eukprot:m.301026 g.301026  ORF g.301026 m.301026 type:complete len:131 (-) comp16425_c0_seq23:3475-3867(-)
MDEERKSATFASHAKSNVSEDEDEDKDGSCVSIRDVIISEKQEAVLKGLSIYIARPLQPDDKEDEYQSPRALTPAVEDSNLLTSGVIYCNNDGKVIHVHSYVGLLPKPRCSRALRDTQLQHVIWFVFIFR